MHQLDEVREALDREYPDFAGRDGDWEDVLARTLSAAPARRRRSSPLIAFAAVVAAVGAAVLLWPGGDSSPRILERARAAAGDGPVIHLVLAPEDARMMEIDLGTGKRRRIQGRHEQWFDPDRGFHDLHTIDGQVIGDILHPPGSNPEVEQRFVALAEYRKALESGNVSVAGKGEVDGRDVYWLRFHVRYPPFGIPSYDADEEVAVDAETYEPRIWRSIPTKESLSTREISEVEIELWETLAANEGDFTARMSAVDLGPGQLPPMRSVRRRLTIASAQDVLSRPPLWLGREFRGLRLLELSQSGSKGLGVGAPVRMRRALDLCYGPRPYACASASPLVPDQPYVSISETTRFAGGVMPRPREGKLILLDAIPRPGARPDLVPGYARRHGVHAGIVASDRRLLVAAAQALRPMP